MGAEFAQGAADPAEPAKAVGRLAEAAGVRVAAAESLTGGLVCSLLAAAPGSGAWFAGGVVAYGSDVKYSLLGVPLGPVVSEQAAAAMARGAVELTKAQFAVALTGVGGPEPQDGHGPGTVYVAVAGPDREHCRRHEFVGEPGDICRRAAAQALWDLAEALAEFAEDGQG